MRPIGKPVSTGGAPEAGGLGGAGGVPLIVRRTDLWFLGLRRTLAGVYSCTDTWERVF